MSHFVKTHALGCCWEEKLADAVLSILMDWPPRGLFRIGCNLSLHLADRVADVGLSLFPVYVRGQAFLLAKNGSAAAADFAKIIDHSGVVQDEPIGALAYLGLARAYAIAGETNKATTDYQDFLTLWKDADPDIPIYKQAKAEYAKLQ